MKNPKAYKSATYDNNNRGINKFIQTIGSDNHMIMEATGVYYLRLAHALDNAAIAFSVINPAQSKYFSKVRNIGLNRFLKLLDKFIRKNL